MAKVILLCGKICSGKSHYAETIKQVCTAVILSCDEMFFDIVEEIKGDFEELTEKTKQYFYKKSVEIVAAGANVILDFGFWSQKERNDVSLYFSKRNIEYEWHYIDISDKDWERNISERNQLVNENKIPAFFLDKGLLEKLNSIFEKPFKEEMDVWVVNQRV